MAILRGEHGYEKSASRLRAESPYVRELENIRANMKSKFFFPGHCGGEHAPPSLAESLQGLELDLPELDGLGNVHDFSLDSDDALSTALKAAAAFYGAARTWFLVNGSTSGILIAALTLKEMHTLRLERDGNGSKKSVFIVSRDAHKSVFDALELSQSEALVLPCDIDVHYGTSRGPDLAFGGIKETIEGFREEYGDSADIAGIIITRPTYQGLALRGERFKMVVRECQEAGVPVVVDEAHGSHWRLLPEEEGYNDALSCGADLVVQSSHKTLGALSQAGMLHLGKEAFSCVEGEGEGASAVHHFYSVLTTTSPNSLFLASLDAARSRVASNGHALVTRTSRAVRALKMAVTSSYEVNRQSGSRGVTFLEGDDDYVVDPLRLTVHFPRYPSSAVIVDEWLCEQRGIWCELNLPRCIVYCVPLGSQEEYLTGLQDGLCEVMDRVKLPPLYTVNGEATDTHVGSGQCQGQGQGQGLGREGGAVYISAVRRGRKATNVRLEQILGKISAESVTPYPPGIPVLLHGEQICYHHLEKLRELQKQESDGVWGGSILSSDPSLLRLSVYE